MRMDILPHMSCAIAMTRKLNAHESQDIIVKILFFKNKILYISKRVNIVLGNFNSDICNLWIEIYLCSDWLNDLSYPITATSQN